MRRVGYKIFLRFCAFLCCCFLGPLTMTQHSLHSVYFHVSTLNSPRGLSEFYVQKLICSTYTVTVRESCIYRHLILIVFREFLVKMMALTSEKNAIPLLFFELTNQLVGPHPRSTYLQICSCKLSTNYPAPNSKAN